MTVSSSKVAWLVASAWAGILSALVCYIEYVGLGAVLGTALLGYGDQNKATGVLLVVVSASLACLCLALCRLPYLAGPRGASLALLVTALLSLQQVNSAAPAASQIPLLCSVMLGFASMYVISSLPAIQRGFTKLPAWLAPAFIYASAISIVGSAVHQYLYSCLQRHAGLTWLIFLAATAAGIFWPMLCQRLSKQAAQPAVKRMYLAGQSLAMIVAVGIAWWGYSASELSWVQGASCARLGVVDVSVHTIAARWHQLTQWSNWPPASHLAIALLWGMAVGCIAGIESQTSIQQLHAHAPLPTVLPPPRVLRIMAGGAVVNGVSSLVPCSLSQSRTLLLWQFGARSAAAVLVHAIALVVLALYASQWLGWLPQLALAVLMTLIAIQMVGQGVRDTWTSAYRTDLIPALGLRHGMGLWLVLGLTALTGQVLWAFVVPAVLFFVLQAWRSQKIKRLKKQPYKAIPRS